MKTQTTINNHHIVLQLKADNEEDDIFIKGVMMILSNRPQRVKHEQVKANEP